MTRTKQIAWMWTVFFVSLPFVVFAGEVDLPKTGQTTCYDESGNVIACSGTGQDGDIQAGVEWPEPRFEDNGDGTITDHLTGLIWLKDAGCSGTGDWASAVSFSNNLASGACGLTDGSVAGDWRLPNIVELESLVNAQEPDPAAWLNTQGFINVTATQYPHFWSSTCDPEMPFSDTHHPWNVSMWSGSVATNIKIAGYSAWPVRGGQEGPARTWRTGQTTSYAAGDDGAWQRGVAWPNPRFSDNGDGTVADNLTGLIWLKNANCAGAMSWNNALTYCNTLASGACGLTDGSVAGAWRLPNRKELFSLIDFSRYSPVLPQGHPFTNVQSRQFWASSTYTPNAEWAWFVTMAWGGVSGTMIFKSNTNSYYVWPVRSSHKGDINGNGHVDLIDAVLALQMLSDMAAPGVYRGANVNNDDRIGLEEVIYVLQEVAGLR